jgi:hypothetical protein
VTVTVTPLYTTGFFTDKGSKKIIGVFKLDFTDTYMVGGDTVDLSNYFRKIDCIVPIFNNGYIFEPDPDTFSTPNAVKIKVRYPTKSQASSLAITASVDYVKGTATTYVPDDSTLGGASLAANATVPVTVSVTDAHAQVDAGPGEELGDGAAYPAGLSCLILVFGS